MEKKPFVTKEQLEKIVEKYPTPFHLYDEKGIRQTARDLYKAFSWNEGFVDLLMVILLCSHRMRLRQKSLFLRRS